jgi:NAD(P)-dependent dehydrogenase (short-subunit alcohol dehydrogenase family)
MYFDCIQGGKPKSKLCLSLLIFNPQSPLSALQPFLSFNATTLHLELHKLAITAPALIMGVAWSQFFPPTPNLTEQNLPSQKGKVFIVTGGASGIGFELATILFQAGGKVYIAGRSESKARQSIEQIKAPTHDTPGQLEYLPLELDDLTTIKASVQAFQAKERKLDVLWNNAGISLPPLGSISKQGHELQLATNCLGPFLVTQLLLPSLHAAMEEQSSTPGSVRVVWTSSQIVDLSAPTGGPAMADIASPPPDKTQNYVASKTGNWFLAAELARAAAIPGSPAYGILSLTQNPGNLSTNLLRHASWMKLLSAPLLHRPRMGAYTELWAGLAPELTLEAHGGAYVVPWGRLHPAPRGDLLDALKSEAEGGTGRAREFWEWCERQTADYM